MSAYALPGLFPPLPAQQQPRQHTNIAISSAACYEEERGTQKVDYRPPFFDGGQSRPVCIRKRPSDERLCCAPAKVSVREAKIDCQQLIQSLTTRSNKDNNNNNNKRTKTSRGLHQTPPKRRNSPPDLLVSETVPQPPQEELAMLFELAVTFQGQQYTVNRSLFRIRQLRQELVNEIAQHNGQNNNNSNGNKRSSCTIPELPELAVTSTTSFSLLHALLRSYAPALEAWLQKVFGMISSSVSSSSSSSTDSTDNSAAAESSSSSPSDTICPTILQFLLEPLLLHHQSQEQHESLIASSSSKMPCPPGRRLSEGRLESITECHHEEDDNRMD